MHKNGLAEYENQSVVTLDGESATYLIKNTEPTLVHPPIHKDGYPFAVVNRTGSPFSFGGLEVADGAQTLFVWIGTEYIAI